LPTGEVIAVNEFAQDFAEVGDKVFFQELAGQEVEYEGEKYLMVRVTDLIAKVC